MKTIANLNALIPAICTLIENTDHEIGSTDWEQDEDGWGKASDYKDNVFYYEEDGWYIEISYKCTGEYENDPGDYWTPPCYDLIRGWGEVTEIIATHEDEETGEVTEFEEDDLTELWIAIDKVLDDIE